MSLVNDYLAWRRSPAVGCVFARLIAVNPRNYDQAIQLVPSSGSPKRIAGTIARRIDQLLADPNVSAGALLLRDVATLEKLCMVALALNERPGWNVTTTELKNSPIGEMVAVHIVREIPFGGVTCPSEALILGPFQEFPATRRSPIVALEIYVGHPRPNDPKTGAPTTRANLAHMELYLPTQKAFDTMWQNSMAGRLTSLGGEDSRAKAKISFVLPAALAERLQCRP